MDTTPKQGNASLSDILSAAKNIASQIGAAAQNYLNVQGLFSVAAISAPAVIKTSAGRLCRVSVTTAGSAAGAIYDGAILTATTRPIYVIPQTVGVVEVNIPVGYGILVVPGSGQVLTVTGS